MTLGGNSHGSVKMPLGVQETVHDRVLGLQEVQEIAQHRAQAHIDQGRTPMATGVRRQVLVREMSATREHSTFSQILGEGKKKLNTASIVAMVSEYVHSQDDHNKTLYKSDAVGRTEAARLKYIQSRETGYYLDADTNEIVSYIEVSLPLIDYVTANPKVVKWDKPVSRMELLVMVLDINTYKHNKRCEGERDLTSDNGRYYPVKKWQDYTSEDGIASAEKFTDTADEYRRQGIDFAPNGYLKAYIDERGINEHAIFSVKHVVAMPKASNRGGARRPSMIDLKCSNGCKVEPLSVKITEDVFQMFASVDGYEFPEYPVIKHSCGKDYMPAGSVDNVAAIWMHEGFNVWVQTYGVESDS